MWDSQTQHLSLRLDSGQYLCIQVLASHTFRIQLHDRVLDEESTLVRYDILNLQIRSGVSVNVHTTSAVIVLETEPPWSNAEQGFGAAFSLTKDEKIVGLGAVTRDRIQKRGYNTMMWVCNVQSYEL